MRKRPELDPDERSYLHALIDAQVPTGNSDIDLAAEGVALANELDKRVRKKEEHAARVARFLVAEGAYGQIRRRVRALVGKVRLGHDGRVIDVSARFGLRPADQETGEVARAWQQRLWTEYTRAEFEALVRSLRSRSAALLERSEWGRRILLKWEEFPQAKTAGEVCLLAGWDPKDLDLGETGS